MQPLVGIFTYHLTFCNFRPTYHLEFEFSLNLLDTQCFYQYIFYSDFLFIIWHFTVFGELIIEFSLMIYIFIFNYIYISLMIFLYIHDFYHFASFSQILCLSFDICSLRRIFHLNLVHLIGICDWRSIAITLFMTKIMILSFTKIISTITAITKWLRVKINKHFNKQ